MTTVTSATETAGTPGTQADNKAATLGKDDFLKLLVAQLQHQDPMNPTDNTEFMAQMTSYSTLEQVTNMAKSNAEMAATLGMQQSLGLIGRTVTYVDDKGVATTGVVEKVVTEGGVAKLTIGGVAGIDPALISEVSTPTNEEQSPS
jgi:flagellar basal-body rod modification protein FlgD